jgi:hypothetical protein
MEHVHSQQSAVPAVNRIVAAAIAAGWEERDAFEASMLLVAAGVSATEAEVMFRDALRRVQ